MIRSLRSSAAERRQARTQIVSMIGAVTGADDPTPANPEGRKYRDTRETLTGRHIGAHRTHLTDGLFTLDENCPTFRLDLRENPDRYEPRTRP